MNPTNAPASSGGDGDVTATHPNHDIACLDKLLRERLEKVLPDCKKLETRLATDRSLVGASRKITNVILKEGQAAYKRITSSCIQIAQDYVTWKLFERTFAPGRIRSWARSYFFSTTLRLKAILLKHVTDGKDRWKYEYESVMRKHAKSQRERLEGELIRMERRLQTEREAKKLGLHPSTLRKVLMVALQVDHPEWKAARVAEEAGEIRTVAYRAIPKKKLDHRDRTFKRMTGKKAPGDTEAVAPAGPVECDKCGRLSVLNDSCGSCGAESIE